MVKPITKYVHVMRREDTNVENEMTTNKVGGKRPRLIRAQIEVDAQSAKRFETTPARSKASTEPRSMEKGSHGDRPGQG